MATLIRTLTVTGHFNEPTRLVASTDEVSNTERELWKANNVDGLSELCAELLGVVEVLQRQLAAKMAPGEYEQWAVAQHDARMAADSYQYPKTEKFEDFARRAIGAVG
jgi:hypothetical protein